MSYSYLLSICLILISTKVLGLITGKLHLPQVVGALLAGLFLGPAVLGWIDSSELLSQLAQLGVIVIMFGAGLGTSMEELKHSGKASFFVAILGVVVPLGLGFLLMHFFFDDSSILESIFIGTVLTATSVSITVEALKEMGKLSTKVGNTILGAALIDDILGLVCLTVITSLNGEGVSIGIVIAKIFAFFIFALAVGFAYNKFMKFYDNYVNHTNLHRFPVAAFALCLFMAWAAETWFGVADIIGAFCAGLTVATTEKSRYIESKFSPLSYLLLTPIFFANIGLEITLPQMSSEIILFSVLLIAAGVFSKLIGCGVGARLSGFDKRQSIQIGFGMVCRGEVALIVAKKGLSMGLLPPELFGSIVLLVVFCAVMTPILLKIAFKGEGKHVGLTESTLVDNYEMREQMDIVTNSLFEHETRGRQSRKKSSEE